VKYTNNQLLDKTVLITGGAGFIGSSLAFYFQENHPKCRVIIFDKFRSNELFENNNLCSLGHFQNLVGFKGEIICGDITCKEDLALLNEFKIDYIFHQAAISDTTVSNQELIMRTNVNAFRDILSLARRNNATVVYASSAATYGNASSSQTVGTEVPNNPYGFSKLMMDNIARQTMKNAPFPIIGLRYFNVYGPREFYKNSTASMVLQLGHQILAGKAPRLFEKSDEIKRDFVYIEDVIQANIRAIEAKKSGIYNVGTGKARSFQDIVDIFQVELGTNLKTEYFVNPYKDTYQYFTQADISQTMKDLHYFPRFTLESGIRAYIPEIKRLYKVNNA